MQLTQAIAILAGAATVGAQNISSVIASNSDLSTLGQLLGMFPSLESTVANAKNVTILAPTNAAFRSLEAATPGLMNQPGLVQAVLSYHVLMGVLPASSISTSGSFAESLLTNSTYTTLSRGQVVEAQKMGNNVIFFSGDKRPSRVSTADVKFEGGIVHVIDAVLTIPGNVTSTISATALQDLGSALEKANLVNTVSNLKEVTVFAPNNAAFAAIQAQTSSLTPQQLASVLELHVINGTAAYSNLLSNGEKVSTVSGAQDTISLRDNAVFVNDARVVIPNVFISNGVVHVIDRVLLPSNSSSSGSPTPSAGPSSTRGSGPTSSGGMSPSSTSSTSIPGPSSSLSAADSKVQFSWSLSGLMAFAAFLF